MNSSAQPPSDPERLLGARLRDTTPAFERRWSDLKRRLRTEPVPRRRYATGWWWGLVSAGVTFAAILFVLRPQYQSPHTLAPAEASAYGELLALDADLRGALPLAAPETLDALEYLPAAPGDPS